MIRLFLFIIIAAFPYNGFGQKTAKVPNETILIKTGIKCDHCLRCATCGPHIVDALWSVKGMVAIKVNPEENTISVTYKPEKTNPETIRKAIADAGYDADDIKANPKSIAKLDKCCRPEADEEE